MSTHSPIPQPEVTELPRPPNARTTAPSEATVARWARTKRLIDTARDEGRHAGLRAGYTKGWRWGLCCGAVAGALTTGAAWAGWLALAP